MVLCTENICWEDGETMNVKVPEFLAKINLSEDTHSHRGEKRVRAREEEESAVNSLNVS